MLKFLMVVSALAALCGGPLLAGDGEASFLGVKKCMRCHSVQEGKDYYDNTYETWNDMDHSKAFELLAGDKAKAIAEKNKVTDPQNDDQCLECHTTAHGVSSKRLEKFFKKEEGVICEACHGPGSKYKKRKDHAYSRETAVANGMEIWDSKALKEDNCTRCHSEESRKICNDKVFNPQMWDSILHPTEVYLNGSKFTVEKKETEKNGKKVYAIQRFKDGKPISAEEWREQVKVLEPVEK